MLSSLFRKVKHESATTYLRGVLDAGHLPRTVVDPALISTIAFIKCLREKKLGRIFGVETYVFRRQVRGQKDDRGAAPTQLDANLIARLGH